MRHRIWICLLLNGVVVGWSPLAHAVDDATKSASRELAKQAKRDFDGGDFAQASSKFQRAFQATQVPTLALWSARASIKLGKLVAAAEYYRRAGQLKRNELWIGDAQEQAQQQAAEELEQLLPRIAALTITVQGARAAELEIVINGSVVATSLLGVAVPTDPGACQVTAKRGSELVEEKLELKEGERRELTLKFAPAGDSTTASGSASASAVASDQPTTKIQSQDSAGKAQQIAGWSSLGVGGLGIAAGVVAGFVVKGRYGDYKSACPDDRCDATQVNQADLDSYNRWRTVSTAGFVVGVVGTAVGVTLLLTQPKSTAATQVGVWMSPTAVGLRGGF